MHPTKVWPGEAGAVILSNLNLCGLAGIEEIDEALAKAIEEYEQLRKIWLNHKSPCLKKECPICSHKPKRGEDELDKNNGGDDNTKGDGDDHQEEDRNEAIEDNEGDGDWKQEEEKEGGEHGDGGRYYQGAERYHLGNS